MVKNNRGWTLIELLIVTAIIGIVGMMGPRIFTATTQMFIMSRVKLELQREARASLYIITRELRQAQNTTIIIDQVTGQPYYSRIRFTKIQNVAVTIAQTGTSLTMTQGNTVTTLSKNLSYLSFSFPQSDDMTIISVAMTLQQKIYSSQMKALHMASERVRVMN